jgi:hypothetical protein
MQWQGWELALLAAAAFIAVTALVRLMVARRDELTEELLSQAEAEHQRQKREVKSGRSQPSR